MTFMGAENKELLPKLLIQIRKQLIESRSGRVQAWKSL